MLSVRTEVLVAPRLRRRTELVQMIASRRPRIEGHKVFVGRVLRIDRRLQAVVVVEVGLHLNPKCLKIQ